MKYFSYSCMLLLGLTINCKPRTDESKIKLKDAPQKLEACDAICVKLLQSGIGHFEKAGRAWIGVADASTLNMSNGAKSKSQNDYFFSDEEASKIRWALIGAVREYRHGMTDTEPGKSLTYPDGKKNWGSVFKFDGCEGNKLQGSKDASQKSLKQCAAFLENPDADVTYRFAIYGNSQVVWANPKGHNLSSLKNGAAFFVSKNPLPELVLLTLKPTASKAVTFKVPINTREELSTYEKQVLTQKLLIKDIKNLNQLSEAWREDRGKKVAAIGTSVSLLGSVALTAVTWGAAAPATAGTAVSVGKVLWTLGTVAAFAGIAADVAEILRVPDRIGLVENNMARGMLKVAHIVLQIASMADLAEGIPKVLKNGGQIIDLLKGIANFRIKSRIMELLGKITIPAVLWDEIGKTFRKLDDFFKNAGSFKGINLKKFIADFLKKVDDEIKRLIKFIQDKLADLLKKNADDFAENVSDGARKWKKIKPPSEFTVDAFRTYRDQIQDATEKLAKKNWVSTDAYRKAVADYIDDLNDYAKGLANANLDEAAKNSLKKASEEFGSNRNQLLKWAQDLNDDLKNSSPRDFEKTKNDFMSTACMYLVKKRNCKKDEVFATVKDKLTEYNNMSSNSKFQIDNYGVTDNGQITKTNSYTMPDIQDANFIYQKMFQAFRNKL